MPKGLLCSRPNVPHRWRLIWHLIERMRARRSGVSMLPDARESNRIRISVRTLAPPRNLYDPQLLMAEAREWRQRAEMANPMIRDIYLTLAAEAEERVALSLSMPILKEIAVPEDDVEVDERDDQEQTSSPTPARMMEMSTATTPE
jgi:hypothetical protein